LPALFAPLPGTPDGNPGSLRADIIAANTNGQDNVIQLQAGLYKLTIPNVGQMHENGAATGDLGMTSAGHSLTIQGTDASATFIDANSIDRAFQVFPNATLVLQNLTVTGGFAVDGGTAGAVAFKTDSLGGGILNGGDLALDHVRLVNNAAYGVFLFQSPGTKATNAVGGGIYSNGTLTVLDSVIANNTAYAGTGGSGLAANAGQPGNPGLAGGYANGGGLYVAGGEATISNSTLAGNLAHGGVGGEGSDGGPSFFGQGHAGGAGGQGGTGAGGALYNLFGTVTLSNSTVSGNSADGGRGGGGGNGSAAGNIFSPAGAGGMGGAGFTGCGGGLVAAGGTLTVSNTTVASNRSQGGNGGHGGAAGPSGLPAKDGDGGGGGADKGGGLFVFLFGTANVHNSTLAFNTSDSSQGGAAGGALGVAGPDTTGQGGGVRRDGGTVNAVSSIFANNVAVKGNDVDFSGHFATAQNNLLADSTGSNLPAGNPGPNGNKVGTKPNPIDPKLLPLDNYGGPTQTLALRPDSPAIDAGANPDLLTTDQRGYGPRAFNGATDIGAFEFGAVPPPPPAPPAPPDPPDPPPPAPPVVFHQLVTRVTKVKHQKRLDVYDAATNALKGRLFPFGKFRGKIRVVQADFNGDGCADLLVLGVQGGRLQQRIYNGLDLSLLA
jgi:hypothetical protein